MIKVKYDLAEAIPGQNKRITVLEQEIADLKSQLQNAQCQITNLVEKQFTPATFSWGVKSNASRERREDLGNCLRIHIERTINKINNFHIWDRVISLHQIGVVNQMWIVCAFLCNAQPNMISV